jgi:hypothetical protein
MSAIGEIELVQLEKGTVAFGSTRTFVTEGRYVLTWLKANISVLRSRAELSNAHHTRAAPVQRLKARENAAGSEMQRR